MFVGQPGQRWVSKTEPELGLGLVEHMVARQVVISFPAAEESRIYSNSNPPLTRVEYSVGEEIKTNTGDWLTVTQVSSTNACYTYTGVTDTGHIVKIHEQDLDSSVQFNKPLDRLFIGQFDKSARFQLRIETLTLKHKHQTSNVHGLVGPRVNRLPHQFFIANEVSRRDYPRVLLADEVGLGKTIEAGLILHRMLLDGRVATALIVVPDNLLYQWLLEMRRRFNLHFSIIDSQLFSVDDSEQDDPNYRPPQLTLMPISYIKNERKLSQVSSYEWDMLIVDEAHQLTWDINKKSTEFASVETLASKIPSVILLTATPNQHGVMGHFSRLSLLDPHRYRDLKAFIKEEENYTKVNALVTKLQRASASEIKELSNEIEAFIPLERLPHIDRSDSGKYVEKTIRLLQEHHGTSRVIFRNTRDNVGGFTARSLERHSFELPKEYLTQPSGKVTDLYPERVHDRWTEIDPRVVWVSEWLKSHKKTKVVCICGTADIAISLEKWLRLKKGIKSAVFHEKLDLLHRDRAAAYFADLEDGAQILVCSEIGSEGRNFQFCHTLILFDLPLDPDLIEQRIGRLDRIGQKNTINIHVPIFKQHGTALLLNWLHEGINAIERASSSGRIIYDNLQEELINNITNTSLEGDTSNFIKTTIEKREEIDCELREGKDKLLQMTSFDNTAAKRLVNEIEEFTNEELLKSYMSKVFDAFGIEQEVNINGSIVLKPGNHMSIENFPEVPDEGVAATYDQSEALSRDDKQFLTWEHPMITGVMDLILNSEFGNSCIGIVKNTNMPKGAILLECCFVIVCPAPQHFRVTGFLPQSFFRVLLNNIGEDITSSFTVEWLNQNSQDIPELTAQKITNKIKEQLDHLSKIANQRAKEQIAPIIEEAYEAINSHLTNEYERLLILAETNKNIRQVELNALNSKKKESLGLIRNSHVKLDAVRILIAT